MNRKPRVLLVTIPEKGHVNPMIGLAQHLVAKGGEIGFYALADISSQLRAAGLDCPNWTPPSGGPVRVTRGSEFADKIRDEAWLRAWIESLLLTAAPGQMAPLRAVVRDFRPDVMAIDPMIYAAVWVAGAEGVPWAGISSSLNPVTPDEWSCPLVETVRALTAWFQGFHLRNSIIANLVIVFVFSAICYLLLIRALF